MIFLIYCWIWFVNILLNFYLCLSVRLARSFSFFAVSLSGFSVGVMLILQNMFASIHVSSSFWKILSRIVIKFCFVGFAAEVFWSWALFARSWLNLLLDDYWMITEKWFSISSWFSLRRFFISRNLSISSRLSNLLVYNYL